MVTQELDALIIKTMSRVPGCKGVYLTRSLVDHPDRPRLLWTCRLLFSRKSIQGHVLAGFEDAQGEGDTEDAAIESAIGFAHYQGMTP